METSTSSSKNLSEYLSKWLTAPADRIASEELIAERHAQNQADDVLNQRSLQHELSALRGTVNIQDNWPNLRYLDTAKL